jgi:pantoate kinase
MKQASAFSPCHITGFFRICDQEVDPLQVGSLGAGIALSKGIETRVTVEESEEDSIAVTMNGTPQKRAVVSERVARLLLARVDQTRNLRVNIDHKAQMPVGAGFGTSGAAALGLSFALSRVLGLEISRIEAAQVAHIAEVECKTGLGTVIAETFGGLELRVKPGAPGIGELKQIPLTEDVVIACLTFGPLSTRELLSDYDTRKRVNEIGGKFVEELAEKPELSNFLGFSRQFADHVGLISKRLRRVLEATDKEGFVCSMTMFGESVFTLTKREQLRDLLGIFDEKGKGGEIIVSDVDFEGARLLK